MLQDAEALRLTTGTRYVGYALHGYARLIRGDCSIGSYSEIMQALQLLQSLRTGVSCSFLLLLLHHCSKALMLLSLFCILVLHVHGIDPHVWGGSSEDEALASFLARWLGLGARVLQREAPRLEVSCIVCEALTLRFWVLGRFAPRRVGVPGCSAAVKDRPASEIQKAGRLVKGS